MVRASRATTAARGSSGYTESIPGEFVPFMDRLAPEQRIEFRRAMAALRRRFKRRMKHKQHSINRAARSSDSIADASRVIEWARSNPRKPASVAFTAGPERQAAYWIEWAWANAHGRFRPGAQRRDVK